MKSNSLQFYKMSGGGNDFVLFDNRKEVILPQDYSSLAQKVCKRKFSVGADGILVLEKCREADFRMVYYNADGSRAEMCGNGARCIARFAFLEKASSKLVRFETDAGPMSAEIEGESVKLKMNNIQGLKLDLPLKLEDKEINLSSINTGVPHAVVLVSDTEKIDVESLGKSIRNHKEFSPAGTNVNFVTSKDRHTLSVRTFERGVEGETLACGTGVVASSLVAAAKDLAESPVSCLTRGGETLKVYFNYEKELHRHNFDEVYLEGPAVVSFRGEVEL